MKYEEGVVRHGLHWRMRKVEKIVNMIWATWGQEAVMTSGVNGKHGEWSWHYYGCAADFRTSYFNPSDVPSIANQLRRELGAPYQVVLHEGSHVHVEFDPVAFGME